MGLDFEASAEDLKVFLDEAEENLQLMEEDIVQLEKTGGANPELLQEIFRAAHTLKGSSATLGHRKMAELTHSMENILDKLRKDKLSVSTAVVDVLFACVDVLKAFKEEIATGQEGSVGTAELLARLAALEDGGPAAAVAVAVQAPAAANLSVPIPELSPDQEARLRGAHASGQSIYWLVVAIATNCQMPSVRAFQALLSLGDIGRIIASWPNQQEVEDDRVVGELQVLLATSEPAARVSTALEPVPEVSVATLKAVEDTGPGAGDAGAADDDGLAARGPEHKQGGPKARGGHTVRVDVDLLDTLMNLVGELVIDRTRLNQIVGLLESEADAVEVSQELGRTASHLGRTTGELQDAIMRARMLPVENLFKKFPRMVRDTAQKLQKDVNFVIRGENTELDRSVMEEIGDPLMHMLRNAVDHGVEAPLERLKLGKPAQGTVVLEALHEENHIIIRVADDGRGIDPEKMRRAAVKKGLLADEAARRLTDQEAVSLCFAPGFSTADQVSDLSGRGVGMDVVHKNIEKLNGTVEIHSEIGKGVEVRVKLPLTLAIIRALLVQVAGVAYAVPLASVTETIRVPVASIQTVRQREVVVYRGNVVLPLLRLEKVFSAGPGARPFEEGERNPGQLQSANAVRSRSDLCVVIVNLFGKHLGIVVDSLIGEHEVVIKTLGKFIGEVPGVSGATYMGDGSLAIVLDVPSLINSVAAAQASA